jgi:hypothetical protein
LGDANVLRTPMFGGCLVFHAPMFCWRLGFCRRQCFVNAKYLSTPKFCECQCFCTFLSAPIFLCILQVPVF